MGSGCQLGAVSYICGNNGEGRAERIELTHPLCILCKSEAQTPQWDISMSTSVSSQGFGVKAWWVKGEVAEVASQPKNMSFLFSSIAGLDFAITVWIASWAVDVRLREKES